MQNETTVKLEIEGLEFFGGIEDTNIENEIANKVIPLLKGYTFKHIENGLINCINIVKSNIVIK